MKQCKENKSSVQVDKSLIPNEVQNSIEKYGIPIYKNILVACGGKDDIIVLKIVDYIDKHYPGMLGFACLEKDDLELVWNESVPKGFDNSELSAIAGYRLFVDSI